MAGWEWASQAEKFAATALPACMWPSQPADTVAGTTAEDVAPKEVSAMTELNSNEPQADSEWDAGALGCGELVMGLRQRLLAMEPGRILKLTATDAGMPADLPAWCGMTGHTLVLSKHPEYWIRRKGN